MIIANNIKHGCCINHYCLESRGSVNGDHMTVSVVPWSSPLSSRGCCDTARRQTWIECSVLAWMVLIASWTGLLVKQYRLYCSSRTNYGIRLANCSAHPREDNIFESDVAEFSSPTLRGHLPWKHRLISNYIDVMLRIKLRWNCSVNS